MRRNWLIYVGSRIVILAVLGAAVAAACEARQIWIGGRR